MACMTAGALPACSTVTRGFAACAGETHDTNTVCAGSSPQVRWICSGVPSIGPVPGPSAACAKGDAAAATPALPAPLKNSRREIAAEVGSGSEEGFSGSECCGLVNALSRVMISAHGTGKRPMLTDSAAVRMPDARGSDEVPARQVPENRSSSLDSWLLNPRAVNFVNSAVCMGSNVTVMCMPSFSRKKSAVMVCS